MIYEPSNESGPLRQAEILSGITQYSYDSSESTATFMVHAFSIVLTQDCDLERDYESQNDGKPSPLNSILMFEMMPLADHPSNALQGSKQLRRLRSHQEARYHVLLPSDPAQDLAGSGLPELIIDFRRYFAVPPKDLYFQCGLSTQPTCRRAILQTPFKEHLQNRATFYLQRIALPNIG